MTKLHAKFHKTTDPCWVVEELNELLASPEVIKAHPHWEKGHYDSHLSCRDCMTGIGLSNETIRIIIKWPGWIQQTAKMFICAKARAGQGVTLMRVKGDEHGISANGNVLTMTDPEA